jgi:hypothetical protein
MILLIPTLPRWDPLPSAPAPLLTALGKEVGPHAEHGDQSPGSPAEPRAPLPADRDEAGPHAEDGDQLKLAGRSSWLPGCSLHSCALPGKPPYP